ncbi:MAG: excinuclease ABC subunit UvrC [Clostridiales Family XIII bacterium]|jgi:excinuclease ABC subunit C|nr:excinuclease ABC subunit UvrC [Clostridiales Family XIII bacterium]
MFDIEENLKQLPATPGVYLHKDADGEVIYVGKASSLRNRVRQYFRRSGRDEKTEALASHIAEFEYIVTGTEAEALLLENTLIKRYRPRYNVMLRDDKTYPYIKITLGEEWPRLLKTRALTTDGSKYFGPYADVGAVNRIIALLNDVYRLKRCVRSAFPRRHRPCLHGHIDRCRLICSYTGREHDEEREALHAEYMEDIDRIISFLKGNSSGVEKYITEKMNEASELMNYEEAARWRDYLSSAKAVTEKQRVELLSSGSMDIVLAQPSARKTGTSGITVFFVRDGKLAGRERHLVDEGGEHESSEIIPSEVAPAEAVAAFISQYYANQSSPAKEILVEDSIPDGQFIAEALSESAGYRVKITAPARGAKKDLLRLARHDVDEAARIEEKRAEAAARKKEHLSVQLTEAVGEMPENPRIEAYDISHTGGADSVGAMVVFSGDSPVKSDYRRFRIRGSGKGDDYAAMQEVLYRRLMRAASGDRSFLPVPDLILIDGGRGHVTAALQVIDAICASLHSEAEGENGGQAVGAREVKDIRLVGMVKDDRHRTRALIVPDLCGARIDDGHGFPDNDKYGEVELKGKSELFHLIGRVQEEAHRFAVDYHQKRRVRSMAE